LKDIANEVNLSFEGTFSALRKMYRVFDLQEAKNKKLSLALEIARILSIKE